FFLASCPRPPPTPLFAYTTLFRSQPARTGRPRAAGHRPAQPAGQCSAVLTTEHPGQRGGAHRGRRGGDLCGGPGGGSDAGAAGPRVRALLPGGPGTVTRDRRDGALVGYRQTCGSQPRWGSAAVVRTRARLDLHPAAADRRCRGRRAGRRRRNRRRGLVTRIMLVEDEESYREPLTYQLTREGYEVTTAADGDEALEEFSRSAPDLVLLDLMLPGRSGVEVCRELRKTSSVPVIMLTAKDGEIDKVVGLEIGADDYVTKPYAFRALLARIRAVLRRGSESATQEEASVVRAGAVEMDVDRHEVRVEGQDVSMPLREFELLEMFLRNPGRVLTRGQLIDRIWG